MNSFFKCAVMAFFAIFTFNHNLNAAEPRKESKWFQTLAEANVQTDKKENRIFIASKPVSGMATKSDKRFKTFNEAAQWQATIPGNSEEADRLVRMKEKTREEVMELLSYDGWWVEWDRHP